MIYLAHGASGQRRVDEAVGRRPERARTGTRRLSACPCARPRRSPRSYRRQVDDYPNAVIGGHSYGGRVASLLAAERAPTGARPAELSAPSARPSRATCALSTGRGSRARSCCCRASRISSRASSSCAQPCRCCRTLSWSRIRASATGCCRSSRTRSTALLSSSSELRLKRQLQREQRQRRVLLCRRSCRCRRPPRSACPRLPPALKRRS